MTFKKVHLYIICNYLKNLMNIEITKPLVVKRDAKIKTLNIEDIIEALSIQFGFDSEDISFGDFIFDKKHNTTYFNTSRKLFY